MQVNDIVIFSPRAGETAEGIVTRVWDKPASDPYVTVRTTEDSPRMFTRFASACVPGPGRIPACPGCNDAHAAHEAQLWASP